MPPLTEPDSPNAGRGALALRKRAALVVPLVVFVAATTKWMSWNEPIRLQFAGDVDDYEKIARAAPHFAWPQITGHVSMWPVHYLIGVTSKATGLPLHLTYWIAAGVVLAAIVVVVDRTLCSLRVGYRVYALCFAALLANPYIFRYLALAPGMLNDTVFILCVCVMVWALLENRVAWVSAALVVAAVARGWSTPPLVLGAFLWFALVPAGASWRRAAVLVAVLPTVAFAVAYWLGLQAPGHVQVVKNCCSVTDVTILGELSRLPGSAGGLVVHVARVLTGVAMSITLVGSGALVLGVRRRARPVDRRALGMLLIAASIVSEPFLLSSSWNAGAEPRLASFAVPPLLVAAALLLTASFDAREPAPSPLRTVDVVVVIIITAVASLSHRFAVIGPSTADQFAVLVLCCALLALVTVAGRAILNERVSRSGQPRR